MTIFGALDAPPCGVDRRALLVGFGLCATAGLAAAMTPHRHEATLGAMKLAELVPQQVAAWSSQPSSALVLPETQEPTSVYDQVLARSYFGRGLPEIMLLIAYGAAQSGMMKVHRPEVCYISSGFSIGRLDNIYVDFGSLRVDAETFTAHRQDRVEQVLYWTRVSDGFPRDLMSERLLLLKRGAQGLIPDGVLVRASVLEHGPAAVALLRQFMQTLVTASSLPGRTLLVGRR